MEVDDGRRDLEALKCEVVLLYMVNILTADVTVNTLLYVLLPLTRE